MTTSIDAYRQLITAPTAYRAGLDSADDLTDPDPIAPQATHGAHTLQVAPRFDTAEATATLAVLLYCPNADGERTLMGLALPGLVEVAATDFTNGLADAAERFLAAPAVFDLAGAAEYDVRVVELSAGDVDLYAWTTGTGASIESRHLTRRCVEPARGRDSPRVSDA